MSDQRDQPTTQPTAVWCLWSAIYRKWLRTAEGIFITDSEAEAISFEKTDGFQRIKLVPAGSEVGEVVKMLREREALYGKIVHQIIADLSMSGPIPKTPAVASTKPVPKDGRFYDGPGWRKWQEIDGHEVGWDN